MDDYQEEKDNPRKQVVDMEVEELYVSVSLPPAPPPITPGRSISVPHTPPPRSQIPRFCQRFKSFIDQYELRELHFHSQMRTKELEVQFNLARYEREKKSYEAELARSRQLNAQVQTFSKTETELRQQLNVYVDKFKQVGGGAGRRGGSRAQTDGRVAQVEDTLNNSNDLFMTFRKEMEDMSKKTKRLERENETLKRKHDQVNGNILKMAEERNKNLGEIDELKKKLEKLNGIIKQMQQQGRGIPQGLTGAVENGYAEGDLDGDESEYEDDEYDEGEEDEEVSDEGDEYDDETEDELHHHHQQPQAQQPQPQPFGPERPPAAAPVAAATTNGHR